MPCSCGRGAVGAPLIPDKCSKCVWGIVCRKYKNIKEYEKKNKSSKWLEHLAKPKRINPKYKKKNINRGSRIKRGFHRASRRLRQLAYSPLRAIYGTIDDFCEPRILSCKHCQNLHWQIQLTKNSIYNQLRRSQSQKNVSFASQGDQKLDKELLKKIKECRKQRLQDMLARLNKPKRDHKPKKPPSKRGVLAEMQRFKHLAIPKRFEEPEPFEWTYKPQMKYFKASERLKNLAMPKNREDPEEKELGYVSPEALTFKTTDRLKMLAIPKKKTVKKDQVDTEPLVRSHPSKYRATERIKELALPKEFPAEPRESIFFKVSKNALKYKPSPRIIKLAIPKQRN